MAICSICQSRKGKRKCLKGGVVCSQCCGETRGPETCTGCSFFTGGATRKNYRSVPYYETSQLANSFGLQDVSNVIESTLCAFDVQGNGQFTDQTAMRLIELLLDVHHFKEASPVIENQTLGALFAEMGQIIAQDMAEVDEQELVKVLASVYRSIQRRTNGGSAYLNFIRDYVGPRVGSGMRAVPMNKF